jgi:hypothetical protein
MLPKKHALYPVFVGAVLTLGAAVLGLSIYRAASGAAGADSLSLVLLAAVTAAFSLTVPKTGVRLSISDVFIFANAILYGPAMAAITAATDGFVGSMAARHSSRRYLYSMFNTSVMCCSAYAASTAMHRLFPGFIAVGSAKHSFAGAVLPILMLGLLYYFLNTGALATVIGLDRLQNILQIWSKNLSWTAAGYLLAALMAGLLAVTTYSLSVHAIGILLLVPAAVYVLYRHYTTQMPEKSPNQSER